MGTEAPLRRVHGPVRRRSTWLSLAVFGAAVAVAVALPATVHQDCPPAPLTQPCIPVTDPHAFLRFVIVALGAIPVLAVIGRGGLGDRRWFGWGILVVTTAAAVLLALPHGLVPSNRGDCPPYPRCF